MFCSYVCVPCVCLVPEELRRGHWILWSWGYGWFGTYTTHMVWVLVTWDLCRSSKDSLDLLEPSLQHFVLRQGIALVARVASSSESSYLSLLSDSVTVTAMLDYRSSKTRSLHNLTLFCLFKTHLLCEWIYVGMVSTPHSTQG